MFLPEMREPQLWFCRKEFFGFDTSNYKGHFAKRT